MLLNLEYSEVKNQAAKGEVNGKKVHFFMCVKVDATNVAEAVASFRGNKNVALLNYDGDLSVLSPLDLSGVNVTIYHEIEKVDMNLDFTLGQIDPRIRVVAKLPKDYSDMKTIYEYSQKYPNLHFEGGFMARLDGCRVGAVLQDDIARKIPENRIGMVAEGNGSILPYVDLEDVDSIEFYVPKSSEKKPKTASSLNSLKPKSTGSSKGSAPKRKLPTLFALTSNGGLDNF